MKLEKRSSAEPEATPAQESAPPNGKKPVIVYILILFIAAFLLMALSFFMHQRSNTEALGALQNSVSAMQEVQATQEKVIELQEELAKAEDQLEDIQSGLEETEEIREAQATKLEAYRLLYCLQMEYLNEHYEACGTLIQELERDGLRDALPQDASGKVVSPAVRYQQLKEAVESKAETK